ncbi:MAG: aminotransferase class III-fold pyridoxal phosphate-dependent enzyme [Gammaproteobacteria bacterium]|nr:aminotransferase class III-fold pyridoxal phosphate-dependent enzyme [Gammaproteobacteria bacterium]
MCVACWQANNNPETSLMTRSLKKSNQHFLKANSRLPLGVTSNFRYWGEDKTFYVSHGKGGRIWDIDDNEYIDYRLGYGPAILGYANEEVDAAAREGMAIGGVFALATEREFSVAEQISNMVPAAELVRFSNSGTEAVMTALRLARAHTGKEKHVMVEGGYHGVFSEVLWGVDMDAWDPAQGEPELGADSEGIPSVLKDLVHILPLNDANRVEDLFKRDGDNIAAFIIEPILGNCCSITAEKSYLQDVRALCDQYNVVLIIDEVKTGFRVARGGVQELMGVKADLCTFAKAVANGYPISVVAGREDIMRQVGNGVIHGGTYTAHSVALAAAEKTLDIIQSTNVLADIAEYGTKLQSGISAILNKRGVAHSYVGHPSMGGLFFHAMPPTNYRDWIKTNHEFYEALAPVLHDHGVIVEPDSREPWFICVAHDEFCLTDTLSRFEKAVDITLESTPANKVS